MTLNFENRFAGDASHGGGQNFPLQLTRAGVITRIVLAQAVPWLATISRVEGGGKKRELLLTRALSPARNFSNVA